MSTARYWLGYLLVAVAYLAGAAVQHFDIAFWWTSAISSALFFAYIGLFYSQRRKRNVNDRFCTPGCPPGNHSHWRF